MNINRENYEAFLLDLIEGRLTLEEEQALCNFLDKNPDLDEELPEIQPLSSEPTEFLNKNALNFQKISDSNRMHFYVASIENQLSDTQKEEFNLFLKKNNKYMQEYESFSKTKFVPNKITYPHKKHLHDLAKTPIIRFGFHWYLRAASILLLLGIGYALALFLQNDASALYVKSAIKLDLEVNQFNPELSSENRVKNKDQQFNTTPVETMISTSSEQNNSEKLASASPIKTSKGKEEQVEPINLDPRVVFPATVYSEKTYELNFASNSNFDNTAEQSSSNEGENDIQRLTFGELIADGVNSLVNLNNKPVLSQQNLTNKLTGIFGEDNFVERKEGKRVKTHVSFGKFKYERIRAN